MEYYEETAEMTPELVQYLLKNKSNFRYNILRTGLMPNVELVYVSDEPSIHIPLASGKPRQDQLMGTPREQLCELAGRTCYDSLGVGRGSGDYHKHILDVKHHSVLEHAWLTFFIDCPMVELALAVCNRKGVWLENGGRLTMNARAMLEWDRHTKDINEHPIKHGLRYLWHYTMPQVFDMVDHKTLYLPFSMDQQPAKSDDEIMVSMWMRGSRGWSHEQVRHRFNMSQRSTRYVDESGSEYIQHPLVTQFLADESANKKSRQACEAFIEDSEGNDKIAYDLLVEQLQNYLIKRGVDKLTSRKQARGAARGYLGNALATEMIFTAPISGWDWMMANRACDGADAEIRERFVEALPLLQDRGFLRHYSVRPSSDGLGYVAERT